MAGLGKSIESHYCGGFVICKPFEKPHLEEDALLPRQVRTVCRCLAGVLPSDWAVDWVVYDEKVRRTRAKEFGLAPHAMVKLIEDVTAGFEANEIGWPGIFYSLDRAKRFETKHIKPGGDERLIGIGLDEKLVDEFLENEEISDHRGKYGIYDSLVSKKELPSKGKVLGYEILGYDYGDFHSWLCNGLEDEAYRELSVKPNGSGLIDSFEEALQVAKYISQDEVGAEPGIWMPWLLVEY